MAGKTIMNLKHRVMRLTGIGYRSGGHFFANIWTKFRWFFLLIVLPAASVQAHDAALADNVAQQLRASPLVRANFTQTKQIAALKRPVLSRGRFVFSKERGIVWELLQPINLTYLLQVNGVIEIGADGRTRRQSGREAQGMMEVGRILNALWSGNTTVLEPLFQIEMQGKPEQWHLKLVPKSAPLSGFLTRIVVSGRAAQIQHVTLIEAAAGDSMSIDFQTEIPPAPLNPQEIRWFDLGLGGS